MSAIADIQQSNKGLLKGDRPQKSLQSCIPKPWAQSSVKFRRNDIGGVLLNIEKIPIEKINPAVYNPRKDLKPDSEEGEIVLDVFGCSGSTLIACEQLNRICYMIEIDPIYCDVIIKRWENFTSQKAVKS